MIDNAEIYADLVLELRQLAMLDSAVCGLAADAITKLISECDAWREQMLSVDTHLRLVEWIKSGKPANQAFTAGFERQLAYVIEASGITTLLSQNARLREALTPFEAFGVNVDENGWTSTIHHERISTWFGPSDFRRARAALEGEPS